MRSGGKVLFFFIIFLFCHPLLRFIFHSATAPYGIAQGLLAPSTPGRVQSTLHPEERKAFLTRLRRLAITGIIPGIAFPLFPLTILS